MTMQYWFMFPAAIMIATSAMASGVGGATFFSLTFVNDLLTISWEQTSF